ncbi:MAG TPA: ceramide glucosyltransferase [Pseudorhodoplanes sp.]|nr:ceramide glucosyltransferase [Pseudorhodoplanes sp.]
MTLAICLAAGFAALALVFHLLSVVTAARRCRPAHESLPPPPGAEPVSLVIPVCGLDNFAEQTLGSAFRLNYPRYEILFCIARADDPAVPLVRGLIALHPQVEAQLLIGDERISANPKLNNVCKGWRAAAHSLIVMPDSNVLMPSDYIQRLQRAWRADTGLVCSPPIGCAPANFWAELECAFLNAYQARWQYFSCSLGLGFAQGKTMMWRREDLERAGGIRALGREAAEDAASTKIVRGAGLHVRLVDPPVRQPLGARKAGEVWRRQMRWARLRRASFPLYYAPELLTGGMPPLAAIVFLSTQTGVPVLVAALAFSFVWYGGEMWLAWKAQWPLGPRALVCALLRDLMLPVLWAGAMIGNSFEWRGNDMSAVEREAPAA